MSADRLSVLFCALVVPLVAVAVITHELVMLIAVIAVALAALIALGRAIGERHQSGRGR